MKKCLLILSVLASSAFAQNGKEWATDYSQSSELFDYIAHIQQTYPDASLDDLDAIVKEDLQRRIGVSRSVEDGSDLDYSGSLAKYCLLAPSLIPENGFYSMIAPGAGLLVINAGRLARDAALAIYSEGRWNGNGDAYRHCYWNNLMVKNTDQEFAKAWGNAHEEYPDNPPLEKWMDISNNNDGRRLAQNHPSDSDKERSSRCLDGVVNKRLVRIVNDKIVPTDGTGRY